MTIQGADGFVSGYSLGGDPRQLGVGTDDAAEQYSAALTVASREDMSRGERRELLDMLGLTRVAGEVRAARGDGSAA